MVSTAQRLFLRVLFLFVLLFISVRLIANPLYTPGAAGTKADPAQTEQDGAKQVRPVRISGASSELIRMQRNLRERVGDLLYSLNEGGGRGIKDGALLWTLFSFSFMYGVLHAAGPGHRKTVVFSLYLTRRSMWWEPLFTSCALAFLHGGTAIVLILILKGVESSIGASADYIGIYLEGFSYLLIIITAVILLIKESIEFFIKRCSFYAGKTNTGETSSAKNMSLVSLFISGLYPCPGAVLVLILSYTLDMLRVGVVCVFVMSAGMSVPICAAAYLAWAGRNGLFQILKRKQKSVAVLSFGIEVFGYILLIAFSLYIALPFFQNFV